MSSLVFVADRLEHSEARRIAAVLEDGIIVANMRRTSRKSKKRASKRAKRSTAKKRKSPPSPSAWTQQETADFLLQRGAAMRQRLAAAMQPAQEGFIPGPFAGTAPQTVNATIALTIAKAEAQYAEILAAIREAEATITKLTEASTATRLNQPLALTVRQAEQINNIFIFVQQQPAVPTQQPATEVQHAPAKLNSFVDHLKKYLDNFFTEGSKSAGKKLGNTIAYGAIVYLLKDQLTALMNHISDWLNTIAALLH